MAKQNKPGKILWIDQTSPEAEATREFYEKVAGWKSSPVSMGEYDDYSMSASGDDNPIAGICHKHGANDDLPSGWIIYIIVENLDKAMSDCREMGGSIIAGPKSMGKSARYCIIEDPAGAYSALYEEL